MRRNSKKEKFSGDDNKKDHPVNPKARRNCVDDARQIGEEKGGRPPKKNNGARGSLKGRAETGGPVKNAPPAAGFARPRRQLPRWCSEKKRKKKFFKGTSSGTKLSTKELKGGPVAPEGAWTPRNK